MTTTLNSGWVRRDGALLAACKAARTEGHDDVADRLAEEVIRREIPRDWEVSDGDVGYIETIVASTMEEAMADAADSYRDCGGYDTSEGTVWVDVRVTCTATGESTCETVEIEPDEPDCEGGMAHDWASPHSIVGGCEQNPGVWGSGGGVIMHSVCLRCGCGRTVDTWAQRMDTGEQGLTSTTYEEGRYGAEVGERRSRLVRSAIEDIDGIDSVEECGIDWEVSVDDDHDEDEVMDEIRDAIGGACDVEWGGGRVRISWRAGVAARRKELARG